MMNESLLYKLRGMTEEEQLLLEEKHAINRSLYMHSDSTEIDAKLLLEHGKLISLRRHPRFAQFPPHTHNYVEMVYMCSGETTHIVNGATVVLHTGELLLLGQNAVQEIAAAGENDIAVNFIILPQFFDTTLQMMGEDASPIRDFLVSCLSGKDEGIGYLHFAVSEILPIQNLVENLIWTLTNHQPSKRSINSFTMGLLFLQLSAHTEALHISPRESEKERMLYILRYIDEHYRDGSLQDIADTLHYDTCFLSREIKRRTGKTFTDLMQDKRLSQAVFLLKTTALKVSDISESVGYENFSYFYRIFKKRMGISPDHFRGCK